MRTEVHPQYQQLEVTCVCGNTIYTGSTLESLTVEICSACHPFYTGTQKIVDAQGRVERFKNRYANVQKDTAEKADKKEKAQKESKPSKDLAELAAAPVAEAPPVEAEVVPVEAPTEDAAAE